MGFLSQRRVDMEMVAEVVFATEFRHLLGGAPERGNKLKCANSQVVGKRACVPLAIPATG